LDAASRDFVPRPNAGFSLFPYAPGPRKIPGANIFQKFIYARALPGITFNNL